MVEITDDKLLRRIASDMNELEPILQSIVLNDTTIIDALAQLLNLLHQMQVRSDEHQRLVAERISSLTAELQARRPIIISAVHGDGANPEIALLEYLYSFLLTPVAVDIGANIGLVSERLLHSGYCVYAFEPYGPSYEKLKKIGTRADFCQKFHAHNLALGSTDGEQELHLATDSSGKDKWDVTQFHSLVKHPMLTECDFTSKHMVQVRKLETLSREGVIPSSIGVLKIDAEGLDVEIVRAMGDLDCEVIMTEFWDAEHPFGRAGHGRLPEIVEEMKCRGYHWHIVIYRVDMTSTLSYYCNRQQSVAESWGNALFFKEQRLYAKALGWCEHVLVPTLFR